MDIVLINLLSGLAGALFAGGFVAIAMAAIVSLD
jgi:hypothetical protein